MSSLNRNRKGFTLVELLVTISILAILSAVTVVGYTNFIKRTAIEVDESLVEQLNIFTDAYLVKHYSNLPEDKKIITDVLDESGVKPLTLQSKEYGYDLWFKCADKTFELKENFLETEGYIRVTDNISFDDNNIEQPGTTTTTPGNTTNGDNNASEPTEDPVFILENFGIKPDSFTDKYAYAEDGAIYVGIKIDDGVVHSTQIDISNIRIKQIISNNEYKYWEIRSAQYLYGEVCENTIIVSQYGTQSIVLNLYDPETKTETSYSVMIYVRNVKYKDGSIELLEKLQYNLEVESTDDNIYKATIEISSILSGIRITGYIDNNENPESSTLKDNSGWKEYLEVEIVINNSSRIISAINITHENITETFYDLTSNSEEISCNIIFRYFGYNGITIEEIVEIPNENIIYK